MLRIVFLLGFLLSLTACKERPRDPVVPIHPEIESPEIDNRYEIFEDPSTKLKGYKEKSGKIVLLPQFTEAHPFSRQGIAQVRTTDAHSDWLIISLSGQIRTKAYYFDNGPDYLVSGFARIVDKDRIGFMDKAGKVVIPAQYDWASPFAYNPPISIVCQGCKMVYNPPNDEHGEVKGGKWGAIDATGKLIVPLEYDRPTNESTLTFHKDNQSFALYTNKDNEFDLVKE